jgi:hypothetical protein
MTTEVATIPDVAIGADQDTETRWRNWQARGAKADRRTAKHTRIVMAIVAAGVLGWLATQVAQLV